MRVGKHPRWSFPARFVVVVVPPIALAGWFISMGTSRKWKNGWWEHPKMRSRDDLFDLERFHPWKPKEWVSVKKEIKEHWEFDSPLWKAWSFERNEGCPVAMFDDTHVWSKEHVATTRAGHPWIHQIDALKEYQNPFYTSWDDAYETSIISLSPFFFPIFPIDSLLFFFLGKPPYGKLNGLILRTKSVLRRCGVCLSDFVRNSRF